jgi:TolB-like protein
MKPLNFFSELKRRNVYKVAVAYAVVAWLLIQAASILFPTFEAPAWVMKVFVVVILLGFPVALVIAWAFEMTPEGMKRTENVAPDDVIPQWSRRKFVALIISLALVAAGLLAFQWLRPKSTLTPRSSEETTASRAAVAPSAIPQKSIAVLPFENLSDEKQNAYFAEGVQDEILTRLAKVADLKVISRTSTQRFKSAPTDLREIAKQLGVTNILEGSVQKANDQVRVNVQLINALTDAHLWAESYDRKLIDIFAVESDVAQRIASSLEAKLSGSEERAINARPTENTEAYQFISKAGSSGTNALATI